MNPLMTPPLNDDDVSFSIDGPGLVPLAVHSAIASLGLKKPRSAIGKARIRHPHHGDQPSALTDQVLLSICGCPGMSGIRYWNSRFPTPVDNVSSLTNRVELYLSIFLVQRTQSAGLLASYSHEPVDLGARMPICRSPQYYVLLTTS